MPFVVEKCYNNKYVIMIIIIFVVYTALHRT